MDTNSSRRFWPDAPDFCNWLVTGNLSASAGNIMSLVREATIRFLHPPYPHTSLRLSSIPVHHIRHHYLLSKPTTLLIPYYSYFRSDVDLYTPIITLQPNAFVLQTAISNFPPTNLPRRFTSPQHCILPNQLCTRG